jgi:dTDP-glucose 4,6-dehydratase
VRILVTGGAGFIGSHFVDLLLTQLDEDSEVIVYDKLTYAGSMTNLKSALVDSRVKFVEGDIVDTRAVARIFDGITHVINFAAESHVDNSIKDSTEFIRSNVLGVQVLLDAALKYKVQKFVQVSTDEVYGSIESGSWDEESPLNPNSPYAASKAAADLLVRSYVVTHGLNASISRCSNNYGVRQFPEKIIPLFVRRLSHLQKVPLYGNGLNSRDWLHVEDHCYALWLILKSGGRGDIYNIGGGKELTNYELTTRIVEFFQSDVDNWIEFVEDRKGHDQRYSVDYAKINRELGYSPRINFEDTFPRVLRFLATSYGDQNG